MDDELKPKDIALSIALELGVTTYYEPIYSVDKLLELYEKYGYKEPWLDVSLQDKEHFFYFIPVPRKAGMTLIITTVATDYSVMVYWKSLFLRTPDPKKVQSKILLELAKIEKLVRAHGDRITTEHPYRPSLF